MKRALLLTLALAGTQLGAEAEINSDVIHNYRYVGLNFEYVHVDSNIFPDSYGVSSFASYELKSILFGIGGGYLQGNDNNIEVENWWVQGNLGYVFRFFENHLNLIPSLGLGYAETSQTFQVPFFPFVMNFDADATLLAPGLTVSYAFNNYLSLNAGYGYGYDLDTEDDSHGFSVGAVWALTNEVGLGIGASFDSEVGFTGLSAGLSYHF